METSPRRWYNSRALSPLLFSLSFLTLLLTDGCQCGRSADVAPSQEATRSLHPVMLLGLDGIEWNVLLPLVQQGSAPNFRSLMERGVYGELATLTPTLSPAIWTSVATGVKPEVHGIEAFKVKTESGGRLVTSQDRRVKAFWDLFSEAGKRVATVGWWASWPAEPVEGVTVAQVNMSLQGAKDGAMGMLKGSLFEGLEDQVYPPEQQQEILALAVEESERLDAVAEGILGHPWDPELGDVPSRLWESSLWAIRADNIYRRVGVHLLQQGEPFDLFAVYFGGPDVIGHRFWRYREPDAYQSAPSPEEVAALGPLIERYYIWMDQVVGELLAAAPADATVLLLSDHGMKAVHPKLRYSSAATNANLISGGHPRGLPTFFIAAGPNIQQRGELPAKRRDIPHLGSIYDILPTICALQGIPLAADFEGEVLEDVVAPGFLRQFPPTVVPTHTPAGWFDARPKRQASDNFESERQDQLRSLGYIE